MKRIISWLLVLAVTAAVAVGGTLAYLTDTDEDVNVMTLGKVKIDQLEYERIEVETKNQDAKVQEFHDNKPLYPAVTEEGFAYVPGDTHVDWEQIGKDGYTSPIWNPDSINNELDKMVFVKNTGDYDAYVRSVFAFEANGYTLEQFRELFHLNLNDTDWTWYWEKDVVAIPNAEGGTTNYIIATATYNKVLKPGEITEISLSQIALDSAAGNADVLGFGETYQILVKSQAIQTDGFTDADTALNQGFGRITADSVPFKNDLPVRGIDLKTALHNLNGDPAQPITAKVTNVIFGSRAAHPEITGSYTGTFVEAEQDVPVFAYYVPNDTGYDVYVLANDTVYAPADSTALFKDMTALTTVDTGNLDVSRVQNMTSLFHNCTALTQVDVSSWDTSNVTTMASAFEFCSELLELDLSGWDTANCTSFDRMFFTCLKLTDVGYLGGWNTSKVTTMNRMFYANESLLKIEGLEYWDTSNVEIMSFLFCRCYQVTELEIGGWDTGKVTAFNSIFSAVWSNTYAMKLEKADVSNWDTSSAVNMGYMFYGCGKLTELDLSKWDVSNVTSFHHTFCDCINLRSINFSGWNTESLEIADAMFNDCDSMEVIDVSDFDMHNVIDAAQMFESCDNLKQIIGMETWDTTNMDMTQQMFQNCYSLKTIDLSSFNTAKLTDTQVMFNNCTSLETIYVGDGWDMSNLNPKWHWGMFGNCKNLVGGNGTRFADLKITDATAACVDTPETPGYLTYKGN